METMNPNLAAAIQRAEDEQNQDGDTQKIIDWLQAMPWDEQSVIVSIIEEHDDMRVLMFTHGSFVDAAMTSIGEIEHLATRDFAGEPVTHVTQG